MASYLENLMKEAKQSAKAIKKSYDASADVKPGADARANAANQARTEQIGQFVGALVRGRSYDDKTGKQTKAKKK
jgi:hypothetical protein